MSKDNKEEPGKPIQALPLSSSEKVEGVLANIRQRGLKDVLDPHAWKTFKQWSDIEKNGLLLAPEDIISFSQQLVYRMIMCGECVNAGKCVACKCAIPQTLCCAAAVDKLGRWGEMMSPEEWFEFFQSKFEFSVIPKST